MATDAAAVWPGMDGYGLRLTNPQADDSDELLEQLLMDVPADEDESSAHEELGTEQTAASGEATDCRPVAHRKDPSPWTTHTLGGGATRQPSSAADYLRTVVGAWGRHTA